MLGKYVLLATSLLLAAPAEMPDIPIYDPSDTGYNYKNAFDLVMIEPLKDNTRITNIYVKVSFQTALSSNATIDITFIRGSTSFTLGTLRTKKKQETLIYEYNNAYTDKDIKNNQMRLVLTSQYGTETRTLNVYYYKFKAVRAHESSELVHSDKNISVCSYGYTPNYLDERFEFKDYQTDVYLAKGEPLRLSNFNFNYMPPASVPLKYSNPRLTIENVNGHFSNFGNSMASGLFRSVGVNVSNFALTKKISSKPSEQLYVNPSTLDTTTKALDGYVKTNHIYFPVTAKEGDTFLVNLIFDSFGLSSYSLSIRINVHIGGKIMGNCMDSSYCVSTEESDAELDLGTKISH